MISTLRSSALLLVASVCAAPAASAQCGSGVYVSTPFIGCACDGPCPQLPTDSVDVDMTPDGRFVVFAALDQGGNWQIFRHDRDGDRDGVFGDRLGRETSQLTNSLIGSSRRPRISDDGGSIVFTSTATDIVQGCVDQNGTVADVYRIDLVPVICGITLANRSRVSVDANGCQGAEPALSPSISGDGSRVGFLTRSALDPTDTNGLVDLYVRRYVTVPCSQVTLQCAPPPAAPVCGVCDSTLAVESRGFWDPVAQTDSISFLSDVAGGEVTPDGNHVVFFSDAPDLAAPGLDTNGTHDVFLRELLPVGGRTTRITSNARPGSHPTTTPLAGSLVGSTLAGRIAYQDPAGVGSGRVHVLDLTTSLTVSSSPAGPAEHAGIAADGRDVAFYRNGSVWLFDTLLGAETRVDCGNGSTQPFGLDPFPPALAADASEVAFASSSSDLVPGDGNGFQDALVVRPERALGGAFCDGSDGVLAQCPCANAGAADSGCENAGSTGGVRLRVLAQRTAAPASLTLEGSGFPVMAAPTALVLRSTSATGPGPIVFRDGLLCLGQPLSTTGAASAAGGVSRHVVGYAGGPGFELYQLWYRSQPASFCDPSAASNLSSGQRVLW